LTKILNKNELLIVDPACGLSGDMFLAALFSLGVDPAAVEREVARLPGLDDFSIEFAHVKSHAISASHVDVKFANSLVQRDLRRILEMIDRSPLDNRIKKLSGDVFMALGEAEGKVHGTKPEYVHFHEVGAVDSIVDIVGAVTALSMLGFPRLYHRPFVLGAGSVKIAHGTMPIPVPATIELLEGRRVAFVDEPNEIVTPTGAALMKVLAGEVPAGLAFIPEEVVYAAGSRRKSSSRSLLRVIRAIQSAPEKEIAVLRTTIDDMNPEIYSFIQERLLGGMALEVYMKQIIMKKGRPGIELTVLCERERLDEVISFIAKETTTIGLRVSYEERVELERWGGEVETPYGAIDVKFSRLPDGSVKAAPEYESCKKVALAAGRPLKEIYEAAMTASHSDTSSSAVRERKGSRRRGAGGTSKTSVRKAQKKASGAEKKGRKKV